MEKNTKYFKYSYENDTTIEYVNTGLYSMLNCSFTSEDPDYGTDTIHFTSTPVESMEQMAYEMLKEVEDFLDYRDGKVEAPLDDYGEYSNSTLIAIEYALADISKNYHPKSWFGHLEDATLEVARRMINDGANRFSFCESNEEEQREYTPEEYDTSVGAEWYGIKRLDPIFDNSKDEYIVAIGYYGGGFVKTAYVQTDPHCIDENICWLAKEMCKIIESITDLGAQGIVFVTEEKEAE